MKAARPTAMPSPTQKRGAEQEALAERILSSRGYRIIERNWRGGGGEVDRIAWLDDLLCFVEVRSRAGRAGPAPEETVGAPKRRRLVRAARAYLTRFPPGALPMVRFDVVGITEYPGEPGHAITVLENAFDAEGHPT